MTIKLETDEEGTVCADLAGIPGSPPVGYGRSEQEAIVKLFIALSFWENGRDWIKKEYTGGHVIEFKRTVR